MDADREISPQAVHEALGRHDDFCLLDVRPARQCAFCHIDGALQIPLNELPERVAVELPDKQRPIVVMCHLGISSLRGLEWLRRQGYEQVKSMAGGIDAWSQQVDESVPRY